MTWFIVTPEDRVSPKMWPYGSCTTAWSWERLQEKLAELPIGARAFHFKSHRVERSCHRKSGAEVDGLVRRKLVHFTIAVACARCRTTFVHHSEGSRGGVRTYDFPRELFFDGSPDRDFCSRECWAAERVERACGKMNASEAAT